MKTSLLEEWLVLICVILTPDTPSCPLGTFPIGQLYSIYIYIPEHSFSLKSHVTMFIPSGKFTSSGSSHECKQDFLDGGCPGWVGSTTILYHLLCCLCGCVPTWHWYLPEGPPQPKALLPLPLSDTRTGQVCTWKATAIHECQHSWWKAQAVLLRFSQNWTESINSGKWRILWCRESQPLGFTPLLALAAMVLFSHPSLSPTPQKALESPSGDLRTDEDLEPTVPPPPPPPFQEVLP